MANPRILKNFHLFVDGRGYAGVVDEVTLPTLTVKTEEHRAGGMDAPVKIDMGMEALEVGFKMAEYDPDVLKLFGVADGKQAQLTIRGAAQRDGEAAEAHVIQVTGVLHEVNLGTWKAGEKAQVEYKVSAHYFKYSVEGEAIHEVDVVNMKRVVNGSDQLESLRTALSIPTSA